MLNFCVTKLLPFSFCPGFAKLFLVIANFFPNLHIFPNLFHNELMIVRVLTLNWQFLNSHYLWFLADKFSLTEKSWFSKCLLNISKLGHNYLTVALLLLYQNQTANLSKLKRRGRIEFILIITRLSISQKVDNTWLCYDNFVGAIYNQSKPL